MRKLVTIKKIDNLIPIAKADKIEIAMIGGWSCIVKKGEFKVGDKGLYFEIDSWIPATDDRLAFLGAPKLYKNREGWRIRTMKMRGVVSQGLLLPLSSFPELDLTNEDHAETLKVEKWEVADTLPPNQQAYGGGKTPKFPAFIPKTDQERLQNVMHYFKIHKDTVFEETLKLDGSSITMYKTEKELTKFETSITYITSLFGMVDRYEGIHFGVCSRNLELKPGDNFVKEFKNGDKISIFDQGTFWATAIKYEMHKKIPVGYAVQAELIGPTIQSNHEKVAELELHVYDIYSIKKERYLTPMERQAMMATLLSGVPHVEIKSYSKLFTECVDFDQIQERVTGLSMNPKTTSEGRVYKSMDGITTFKAISNKYLLKEK